MSIRSTLLSTILSRMDRYQAVLQNNNEVYKIRDIDEEIRALRRMIPLPWTIQKSSLRVFAGVLEYPVANDHDELAYLDISTNEGYPARARFRYTSLSQFYEDPDNRNQIAEIWDGNQRKLGVDFKNINVDSQVLNRAETITDWSVTGDAGAPVLDVAFYKEGNGSIRVPITLSTGTAGVRNALSSAFSLSDYQRKYHFKLVYLDAVPTSLELRLEISATRYLSTSGITTQFDGTPLKADQWNLIAQDLNTAINTGSVLSTESALYERVVFTGAATGTYYFDTSYARNWEMLDYWYYSIYSVIASGGTVASKEYFYDDTTSPSYNTGDSLVGDSEWIDCIMYGAIINNCIDIKDKATKEEIVNKRNLAWSQLLLKYPSMDPIMVTNKTRYVDDFIFPPGMDAL